MDDRSEVYSNNVSRRIGKEAQKSNFDAVIAVSEILKSTLGPKGMDKMLIDEYGDIIITNDGVKILKEMQIEHPAAKMVVEVAKTQEKEVGDGTTTSVIYTGELIKNASELLSNKIHPTIIIKGYQDALKESLSFLEKNSIKLDVKDFNKVAETSMTGKVSERYKKKLSEIVVNAIEIVKEDNEVPLNRIKIQKVSGRSIEDSKIIKGIVLDKEVANINMPKTIENPKILLIETPLEISELSNEVKYEISTPEQYEMFLRKEEEYLRELVDKIKSVGVNVVFCQKGIDDTLAYYLAKNNILAVRRVKKSDMEKLSFALNIDIVSSKDEIKEENLGTAEVVKQKKIQDENYIFVENCENPKSITILLKSSTIHVLDEIERAIEDALGNLEVLVRNPRVVPGGGSIEISLSQYLKEFSKKYKGREQIAINKFSDSLLSIPKILAENSGFDSLDLISEALSKYSKGFKDIGIESEKGLVENILDFYIYEPLEVKSQALKSAVEVTSMLLRIDDIIAAKKIKEKDLKE